MFNSAIHTQEEVESFFDCIKLVHHDACDCCKIMSEDKEIVIER